jgi:hypothetical protein
MTTRAKFKVTAKTELEGTAREVKLMPVTGGLPEDNLFGKLTPSGEIRLYIVNPPAAAMFEVGKAYYVDFTPADVQP